jgi:hypothetical protein
MNRRGALIAVDTLIRLGIVAVIFLVVFLGIFPGVERKLEAAETKGKCEWSILLSAVRKGGTASLAEGIPEGCKADVRTITMKDLDLRFARNRLETIQGQAMYDKTAPYFRSQKINDALVEEFALDRVIADELERCWTKVFRGKMPLFDEWWRLYNCRTPEGKSVPCSKIEDFARFAIPVYGVWTVFAGKTDFENRAPVNCVLCSHILFDDEVKKRFGGAPITSLREWMANNQVPNTDKAYLEYLTEGQTLQSAIFTRGQYDFEVTNDGLAILYERINAQQLGQFLGISFGGLTEDQNFLKLMPYQQDLINAPKGDCTFLLS